jgi:methyl-accepting chemotaxis protein
VKPFTFANLPLANFSLRNMKLAQKIPALVIGSAMICGIAVGVSSYFSARNTVIQSIDEKLDALLVSRSEALKDYLNSIDEDVISLSSNNEVINAIKDYTSVWGELGPNPTETLQNLYIHRNPNPIGHKEDLDNAPDGSKYSQLHAKYHPWFRNFLRRRGYYDIFLINTKGDVVATVFKEADFATNLFHGTWKDTDLANVFRKALSGTKDTSHFSDFRPYSPSNNVPASFIATPVYDHGQLIGALAFQMPIERINKTMSVYAGLGQSGDLYLVGQDNLMRSDSRFKNKAKGGSTILTTKVNNLTVQSSLQGTRHEGLIEAQDWHGQKAYYVALPFAFKGVKWAITGEQSVDEVMEPVTQMQNMSILLVLVSIGLIAFISILICNRLINPLKSQIGQMEKLSAGDLNLVIDNQHHTDEIGDMARALETFKNNALEKVRLEEDQVREKMRQEEAEQQAKLQAEADKRRMMNEMADEFEATINSLLNVVNQSVSELQSAAENMTQVAEEANSKTATVAEASDMTARSVETVVQSTQEMIQALDDIASNIERSSFLTHEAVSKADNADKTTATLSVAAKEITTVIELIQEITSRINLLSLNAAIEAAIAGESGKGFAVVASEVKRLAVQTADATESIATQIQNVQSVSSDVVGSLGSIRGSIATVNECSTGIASAMAEQNAITNQIATYMREASDNVQRINLSVDDIQMTAQSTASSAEQVLQASRAVARQSDDLNTAVQEFVSRIRRG